MEVRFSKNTVFIVNGSLIVNGTQTAPVVFTANSTLPYSGFWEGLKILYPSNSSYQAVFRYCEIKYAKVAVDNLSRTQHANIKISHSAFIYNVVGLRNNRLRVDTCSFTSNQIAIQNGDYRINHCSFSENMVGVLDCRQTIINSSTFKRNETAIHSARVKIYDSEIFENSTGVVLDDPLLPEINNCNIYKNRIGIQVEMLGIDTSANQISNNRICHNQAANLFIKDESRLSLKQNCWCLNEADSIKETIFDFEDSQQLGYLYIEPFLTCDFLNGRDEGEDLPKGLFKIQGTVSLDGKLLSTGICLLYEKSSDKPIAIASITGGAFLFHNILSGDYLLQAIPNPEISKDYLPSYYVNRFRFSDAHGIVVKGDVFDVDLKLIKKEKTSDGILGKTTLSPVKNDCHDLSLTGFVYTGNLLLTSGVVLLYSTDAMEPSYRTNVIDGRYELKNIPDGYYQIYAIPNPDSVDNYIPTYYSQAKSDFEAEYIYVSSEGTQADITLIQINRITAPQGSIYSGTVKYVIGSDANTLYREQWFQADQLDPGEGEDIPRKLPVFVHNNQGEIVDWYLTDFTGGIQFTLPSPDYYITIERKGYRLIGDGRFDGTNVFYIEPGGMVSNTISNSSPDYFAVFPNPTSDYIQFNGLPEMGRFSLRIFSSTGEEVANKTLLPGAELDIRNLPSGIYSGKISNDSFEKGFQFIKL